MMGDCQQIIKGAHGGYYFGNMQIYEVFPGIGFRLDQLICLFKSPAQRLVFVILRFIAFDPATQQRCVIYQAAETD